jgi:hypothetical protein
MPPKSFSTLGAIGGGSAKAPPAPATVTTHPAPPAPATVTTHPATPVAATGAASKATCKFGDKCYGCKICGKSQSRGSRGNGGGGKVDQLSSEIIELKKQLDEMKSASASTDARLGKVEKDVVDTNDGVKAILAMMREDRKQPALPPLPARPAIMPPSSTLRSQSPPTRMELVTSGPEGSFGKEYGYWVPQWGSSKTTSTSSGSYTGQNGWADHAGVAGGGAIVVSSKSKEKEMYLPLPSTLSKSKSESRDTPKLNGTGLVLCTNFEIFKSTLASKRFNEVLTLITSMEKKGSLSDHFVTLIVNAYDLCDTEADLLGMLSADIARPVSQITKACQIRSQVIASFDESKVGMFMNLFARMAENYHSRPDKGVKIDRHTYSYKLLALNRQYCLDILKYLRDN